MKTAPSMQNSTNERQNRAENYNIMSAWSDAKKHCKFNKSYWDGGGSGGGGGEEGGKGRCKITLVNC